MIDVVQALFVFVLCLSVVQLIVLFKLIFNKRLADKSEKLEKNSSETKREDKKKTKRLKEEIVALKKERDAAITDINELLSIYDVVICRFCKYYNKEGCCCSLSGSENQNSESEKECKGEWRGVVPGENTDL